MKTAYSTYSTPFWHAFKRLFPQKTERDYCDFSKHMWLRACSLAPNGHYGVFFDRDSVYADAVLEFLWRFRSLTHYFLAKGVSEFCVSSVKEFTDDYCKTLPQCDPVDAPETSGGYSFPVPIGYYTNGTEQKVQGGFAIHFPSVERQRSIIVIPNAFIPIPPTAVQNNTTERGGALVYYFIANDGIDTIMMQRSASIDCFGVNSDSTWIAKLIFGLSLYMDAFPDSVVDAGSDNVHQIKHYDGARHIVNRNEIVDEENRHGVSPHWRRGHFRLLSSKHFVRKHGQTVYVRGTFVKGRAFDVMDDTPLITQPV